MGMISHKSLVVTSGFEENINEAYKECNAIFNREPSEPLAVNLISPILKGIRNNYFSFFVAPDGSKEGWDASNLVDGFIEDFTKWIEQHNEKEGCNYIDYIYVEFGGDYCASEIIKSSKE